MMGQASDEAVIAAALPKAETRLEALEQLIDGNPYLAGDRLSLADLLGDPDLRLRRQTPDGQKLLQARPNLRRWWHGCRTRPSVARTSCNWADPVSAEPRRPSRRRRLR